MVCGNPELDFAALEGSTRYEGYDEDHRIVKEFWSIVHSMSLEQKKQLLCFATGSARAPIRGLGDLRLVIVRASGDSEQLPTAHTCFNTLLLAEYSTPPF